MNKQNTVRVKPIRLKRLNKREQAFAGQYSRYIDGFLRAFRLDRDTCYDAAVHGYLQAVRKYLWRWDLRRRYKFSTIAFRSMRTAVSNQRRAMARRVNASVSLDEPAFADSIMSLQETIPDDGNLEGAVEAAEFWSLIQQHLSESQIRLIALRAEGYEDSELARMLHTGVEKVQRVFERIQQVVMEVLGPDARALCLNA